METIFPENIWNFEGGESMNREEYLKRLSFLLKDLPEEEIEDAIAYYEDYFEEAGEEKEEQVIKKLGSPEDHEDDP